MYLSILLHQLESWPDSLYNRSAVTLSPETMACRNDYLFAGDLPGSTLLQLPGLTCLEIIRVNSVLRQQPKKKPTQSWATLIKG